MQLGNTSRRLARVKSRNEKENPLEQNDSQRQKKKTKNTERKGGGKGRKGTWEVIK